LTPFKSLKTSISQTFVNNMFDAAATIMAKLHKKRWQIESFLKQQKQNFELKEFYSDED
jgi:IS4 transposase